MKQANPTWTKNESMKQTKSTMETINQTSIFQHRQISKSQNKPTLFLTNLQLFKIVNEVMTTN